jgi:hypothetical protein
MKCPIKIYRLHRYFTSNTAISANKMREGLMVGHKIAEIAQKYQKRVLGSNCPASITPSNAFVLDSFLSVLRIKKPDRCFLTDTPTGR